MTKKTKGIIIGKFLPPHKGHKYLFNFGRNYVDELYILVCTISKEPIDGALRHKWVQERFPKEIYPNVHVIHNPDENPQEPSEHPDFWNIWKESILKHVPGGADYLFASEGYGRKLAEILGSKYIPVDHLRELVPTSGTSIRENPFGNREYIPTNVRKYYSKRICIYGNESSGKSTLTKLLARHYNTVYVGEYARSRLNHTNGKFNYEDLEIIGRGHKASEEAMLEYANKLLFVDTDIITTTIYSKIFYDRCDPWIIQESKNKNYDMYLLCDIDIPYEKDNQRYFEQRRKELHNKFIEELNKRNKPFHLISGNMDQRLTQSIKIIDRTFKI